MVLTYHWSLAINKLQKIFTLRCKMPLQILKNDEQQMKQSRSEQNSQIFVNKLNKHVRYLSLQPEIESESQQENYQSQEQIEDIETPQKSTPSQNNLLKLNIAKISNQQGDVKESAHFRSQNSLDQLRFNEEFLELFKKQRELTQFGQLSQSKIKEQEILIKKIIDSRPSKPHPDLKTFLSLLKKPQIEVQQAKIIQQNQQPVYLILIILFISLISIYIIV
ncbi:unnamed protein product (macronuclear) [Paramecium tetraurelia]|uniref:Transmembrane protein n=1 Tax=Paramecium tetraurelia TaxID=5888 RepID=A0D484_PARTE|nr:uncharacterized protein GSPATT00013317001 [Paramecium tetraurelia]CAK77851.1 unnamed protein product [Paramecium tetraurelia]|eukprot:XP_001445248.1 hypothetical protein (macronuclear) [Paramecium tetraurelia strain d4-2]